MIALLAAAAAGTPNPVVAGIIATERAFAADTARRGPAYSFRDFVAPNAVGIAPDPETGVLGPIDVAQRIKSRPRPPAPKPADLRWWPAIAGVSNAGDLGFTSGPVIFPSGKGYGFVFTVWELQSDGSWKFFFDGGPNTDGPSSLTEDQPVKIVPAATALAPSPENALREVAEAEAHIATAAVASASAAYRPYLTSYTQLMGSGGQPTFGQGDASAELAKRGKTMTFTPLGARSAKSADFVFTYGRALIDGKRNGGYARVWLKTSDGWRLALDQVQVPEKPVPPAPSGQ